MADTITLATAHDLMQSCEVFTLESSLMIAGTEIPCEALTLTLDENGQDWIDVKATMPGRLALDARTAPRAALTTALGFPDRGEATTPTTLDLICRSTDRTRQPGADHTDITLQSAESLIRDDSAKTTRTFTSASLLTASVTQIIHAVIPGAAIVSEIPTATKFLTGDDTIEWEPTKQPWAVITEMCDNATIGECECLNNGINFVIRRKPTLSTPGYVFTEGANIAQVKESTSRDDFYNAVRITRADGTVTTLEDNRAILGVAACGRRLKIIETKITGTAASAAYAQAAINRAVTSGFSMQIVTPDCPLGLAPGMTVSVFLDGALADWLIARIEFDLKTGITTLNLRKDA